MNGDTVSLEEMAAMHGINAEALRRILLQDEEKPLAERRLPGAYHTNLANRRRGEWRIPRVVAEAYKPRRAGRPKESE